jgi:hypothetical protein
MLKSFEEIDFIVVYSIAIEIVVYSLTKKNLTTNGNKI